MFEEPTPESPGPKLHIGGQAKKEGWLILNIQPGPIVDLVGDCTDLSRCPDGSFAEVYASHVLEHLGYRTQLPKALREIRRVLRPGGVLRISVPNFTLLCKLFVHPDLTFEQRYYVMQVAFGGQINKHDFHYVGMSWEILSHFLRAAGYTTIRRVKEFGLFDDASSLRFLGQHLISLNVEASG